VAQAAVRLVILTVSDGVANGTRRDGSGDAIAAWAAGHGWRVVAREVLADDAAPISAALARHADAGGADVILTTGGTGLTARDVTPEATQAVLERLVPGIPEALRRHGEASTVYAMLSRGLAGTRGSTLIVNLPGSERGVRDGLAILERVAGHAVQLLRGTATGRHEAGQGTDPNPGGHG
jgi:molybdenum cofactor synthesis domain-containing protein